MVGVDDLQIEGIEIGDVAFLHRGEIAMGLGMGGKLPPHPVFHLDGSAFAKG